MSERSGVPIVLLGLGQVGQALLRQILEAHNTPEIQTVGVADSQAVLLNAAGLPDALLEDALQIKEEGGSLHALSESRSRDKLDGALRPGTILVDVSASSETTPTLRTALDADGSVVLANKLPLTGPWADVRSLLDHPNLRYEATVGAGLPVIATLDYLLETGDHVTTIIGCFSGTLGYLCAQLERGETYAAAVAQARALGYTEPDPREDLSGRDVARKALILARTVRLHTPEPADWPLTMEDLTVEALYPETLADIPTEAFMDAAPTLNETYAKRFRAAQAEGHTLRYVARIGPTGGEVGLVPISQDSTLSALRGPTNYVAFHTARYADVPLTISGPGAGPVVTAAGVLGDIIDVKRKM